MRMKLAFGFFSILILNACTLQTQTSSLPAQFGPGLFGASIKFEKSQCPSINGGYYRKDASAQVTVSNFNSGLKVNDLGVDFQIDGQQHVVEGDTSSTYIGTCFQKQIIVHINSQFENKKSNLMLIYIPSKVNKNSLDRSLFKNGSPSDMATYIPFVES